MTTGRVNWCCWCVIVAAVLLPARPARADAWNVVTSRNFRVVGEVDHGQLREVARTLEQFRTATTQVFPARTVSSARPLTILVINRGTMLTFVESNNVAGFYSAAGDHDYIVMRSDMGSYAMKVALHEYQHLINYATWSSLPRWVNEGLAEFYSTFYESDGGKRYQVGLAIPEHLRFLKLAGEDSLVRFLTDDGRSMSMDERTRTGVFYAQSWALIHFFTFGDGGMWSAKLAPFVEALVSGMAPADALRQTVTADLRSFESRFRTYLRNDRFQYAWFSVSAVETVSNAERAKLSVAETETLKATLMRDEKQASRSIDLALQADPTYHAARGVRARRLLYERESGALEALRESVRSMPEDLYTCGHAMLALNIAGLHSESLSLCATDRLSAAVALERFIALEALGRVAETGTLRARLLVVPSHDLSDLSWRTWRYLEAGQYAAARRVAEILASRQVGSTDNIAYMRVAATVARCMAMDCPGGREELKRVGIPPGASVWVQNVSQFLVEAIDGEALLKMAKRKTEETEAHAYIGLDLLARGRRDDALSHLEWVLNKGTDAVSEYYVATATYRRLASAQNN